MSPQAIIGMIIAMGLSLALVIAVSGLAYWNRALGEPGAEIVSVVVGGLVAALATVVARLFGEGK